MLAIGLVALSVVSCHKDKNKRQELSDWENRSPNYYVNDGNGYNQGGVSPFWIFWAYQMGRNGSMTYVPTYAYRHYSGIYYTSSAGKRTSVTTSKMSSMSKSGISSVSRGNVARGGFGSTSKSTSKLTSVGGKTTTTTKSMSTTSRSSTSTRSSSSVSRGGFSGSRGGGIS